MNDIGVLEILPDAVALRAASERNELFRRAAVATLAWSRNGLDLDPVTRAVMLRRVATPVLTAPLTSGEPA